MNAVLIFACAFGIVFALTAQQLNISGGHKGLGVITSFAISGFNLVLFKLVPMPTSLIENAAYLCGGPVGLLVAWHLHPCLVRFLARRRAHTSPEAS